VKVIAAEPLRSESAKRYGVPEYVFTTADPGTAEVPVLIVKMPFVHDVVWLE
jgi:hypothetical protein